MASFVCPECRAEVTKDASDGLGCPCCGYCSGLTVMPEVRPIQPSNVPWTPPYNPWYVPTAPPQWTETYPRIWDWEIICDGQA